MNTSLPIKIAVISGFVLLIGAFVAFRSGAFETNGPAITTDTLVPPVVDSAKTDTTQAKKEMMSGSKMMILIEDKPKPKEEKKPEKTIMDGPKSGKIIQPDPAPENKNNNANQSNNVINLNESMMGSSKSGIIFKPEKDSTKKKDK